MRDALLVVLTGVWLAGCAERLSPAEQEYQSALNRQATVRIQAEAAEELARLEQASSQDLGAPRPLQVVIVTTGSLSQPHEALGTVEADTTDISLSTSDLYDALFRPKLAVAVQGHSPKLGYPQMDERLRTKARQQYGAKADAVINVTYRTNYDGDVFASGLAVHFVEQKSSETQQATAPERRLEDRLKELKDLREKGLISVEEYNQKRQELLQGL